MKRRNRGVAVMCAVILATGCFAGCGSQEKETGNMDTSKGSGSAAGKQDESQDGEKGGESSGYQTTYGDKVFDNAKITVELFDRSNAPDGVSLLDNKWTQYINENMGKVGIKVEFVAVPRSEELSKVQTMMAAGTGPDLMLCYTKSVVQDYYNQGGTYDLAPYVDGEKQVLNLKQYLGSDVLDVARNSDGSLWSIPARRSTTAKTNLFIRKDWLDALGMEIPTTPDELYDVLYAFKNNNPEGRTDVIASNLWTNPGPVSYAFLKSATDEKEFAIANEGNYMIYSDEGYADYLRFINRLYNEGLMDQEYYVNNDFGQTVKEYFVNGQLGCFEYDVNGNVDNLRGGLLQNLKINNPDAEMISIPPLKNVYDGKVYNNGYPLNGAYVFIPKTCKNVEAAMTYLDWLATKEGGFTLFHGFEGEHYIDEDGVPVVKDAAYNATDKDWLRHDLFLVGNQGYYATEEEFTLATSKELPGWEDYVINNYQNATYGIQRNDPTFSSPTLVEKNTELGLVADEYIVQLITCKPDEFDGLLKTYKEELENYDIQKLFEERKEYYDDFYGN